MENTTTQNSDVLVIQNSIEIIKRAPNTLLRNQNRTNKALQVGRNILEAIQQNGMNPDLDERAKKYLVNASAAMKEMNEDRSEFTQIMDELKKMFTKCENDLDVKKSGTVVYQVQTHRDAYAKQIFEENERKRKYAERRAAIERQKIECRAAMETLLANSFTSYLLQVKQRFVNNFNSLELDSFADNAAAIRKYQPAYSRKHFDSMEILPSNTNSSFLTANDINLMVEEVKEGKYERFSEQYAEEMTALKNEIVDKIQSKYEELREARQREIELEDARIAAKEEEKKRQEEIAKANAKEKKHLEDEAAKAREAEDRRLAALEDEKKKQEAERMRREQEDRERLEKEAADAKAKAEHETEIKKQGEQTMLMFEQEAANAELSAPDARQGYELLIKHPAGYVQVFQFWFEKEGKNLPVDKIGRTKMDQMKAFCEKYAHKNNELIESKFLEYQPTYKAVNRK